MGFRNPFTLGDYDPATGALWMADYGPDAVRAGPAARPRGSREAAPDHRARLLRLADVHDEQRPLQQLGLRQRQPGPWFDCEKPVNDSPVNTGLVNLPPAKPAQIYYTYSPSSYFPALYGGGAMAGPQYRYDASNPSPTKFPAWFDGRRFLFDWTQNWVQTTGFDGKAPVGMARFASAFEFSKPMDMTFGPDGSLYVLEYGNGWGSSNDDSGIYRIDYVEGNRKPVVHQKASTNSGALPLKVDFDASDSTDPDGDALSYAWDFDGDGTTDATTAKASHTYTTAGTFTRASP